MWWIIGTLVFLYILGTGVSKFVEGVKSGFNGLTSDAPEIGTSTPKIVEGANYIVVCHYLSANCHIYVEVGASIPADSIRMSGAEILYSLNGETWFKQNGGAIHYPVLTK
jgi:hypothetical protein